MYQSMACNGGFGREGGYVIVHMNLHYGYSIDDHGFMAVSPIPVTFIQLTENSIANITHRPQHSSTKWIDNNVSDRNGHDRSGCSS